MAITNAQKKIKAKIKIESLELAQDLTNIRTRIDQLFDDAPIIIADYTSKEELEDLISSIKKGTASNIKISRFLDIASNIGI
jgi:hypothetical protein